MIVTIGTVKAKFHASQIDRTLNLVLWCYPLCYIILTICGIFDMIDDDDNNWLTEFIIGVCSSFSLAITTYGILRFAFQMVKLRDRIECDDYNSY